jgi:hypothetical protein
VIQVIITWRNWTRWSRRLSKRNLPAEQRLSGFSTAPNNVLSEVARLSFEAHMLHTDNFLAGILGDGLPNGYVVRRQAQLIGTRQRIVTWEGVGQGWDGLI